MMSMPLYGNPFWQYSQWYWDRFNPLYSITATELSGGPSTGPSWQQLVDLLAPQQPSTPLPVDWSGVSPGTFPTQQPVYGGPPTGWINGPPEVVDIGFTPTYGITVEATPLTEEKPIIESPAPLEDEWPIKEPGPLSPVLPGLESTTPTFKSDVWAGPPFEEAPPEPDVEEKEPGKEQEPDKEKAPEEKRPGNGPELIPKKPKDEEEPSPPETPPAPGAGSIQVPKPQINIPTGSMAPLPGPIPGPVGNEDLVRTVFNLLYLASRIPSLGELLGGNNVDSSQKKR